MNATFSDIIKGELAQNGGLGGPRARTRGKIRDAFIKYGSLCNPQNAYHLEFTMPDGKAAGELVRLLGTFGLAARANLYRGNHVVYIKQSEAIAEFLRLAGASKSLFELENLRILKQISNDENRKVNFEISNLSRVVRASVAQTADIEVIDREMGIETLPPALAATAAMRLEFPDDSLEDLAARLGITKSGVNHRLRRIAAIAESVK
jgi:hypothetical protein